MVRDWNERGMKEWAGNQVEREEVQAGHERLVAFNNTRRKGPGQACVVHESGAAKSIVLLQSLPARPLGPYLALLVSTSGATESRY